MRVVQSINVVPNPYTYLDDEGDPCGLVPVDPSLQKQPSNIGAVAKSVTMMDDYEPGHFLSSRRFTKYEYTTEPVTLQLSNYYRELVKGGELIAADKASAEKCGVEYVDVKEALAKAAAAAAENCFAAYGIYPEWYVPNKPEAKAPAKLSLVPDAKPEPKKDLNVRRTSGTLS